MKPVEQWEKHEEVLAPYRAALTATQNLALTSTMKGEDWSKAAQDAGVTRDTVAHWHRNDPTFVAAIDAWRQSTMNEGRRVLLSVRDQALATVMARLEGGELHMSAKRRRQLEQFRDALEAEKKNATPPAENSRASQAP